VRQKISERLGKGFGCILFKVRLNKIKGTKNKDKENKQHGQFETIQDVVRVYHKDKRTQH
jgi:hypothetical protein